MNYLNELLYKFLSLWLQLGNNNEKAGGSISTEVKIAPSMVLEGVGGLIV